MSDDASNLSATEIGPPQRDSPDAAVLRFPSNRPPDPHADRRSPQVDSPRLRDVIGDVLREERHHQERTLADVARQAAVSVPYLSEVERGRKEVSSDLLEAIGTALELPLVEILERSVERVRALGSVGARSQCTTGFQLAA